MCKINAPDDYCALTALCHIDSINHYSYNFFMQTLYTDEGRKLLANPDEIPWQEYPRPLLQRDSFLNLCGWWSFTVYDNGSKVDTGDKNRIRVPFPPESVLSGIEKHFPEGASLIYEKDITLPPGFRKDIVLLHIDGADQHARVFINDEPAGEHSGGYEHFTIDITSYGDSFSIKIETIDDLRDRREPYGKQRLKRGGMWYTPFSGIWQPVWIESVPHDHIRSLTIDTDMEEAVIDTKDPSMKGTLTVTTPNGILRTELEHGKAVIRPEVPRLWSPDDPYLYNFTIVTEGGDEVHSYFALRKVSVDCVNKINRILLNGKPIFFHGLLDQGYYSDGLCTPADPSLFEKDILTAKSMGFNALRKHIKVESDIYYAACDRLGMIVFQDMVNNGKYSFFRDTIFPNLGFKKKKDKRFHRDEETRSFFMRRMEEAVEQLYSFPCILYWTIFNEGWGQFDSVSVCERLKKLDQSRIIDAASGWFDQITGDVYSVHVYNNPYIHLPDKRPIILSECGGYSYGIKDHIFNTGRTYGYGSADTSQNLYNKIKRLYLCEIRPYIKKGLCGSVYTQLSDVEDETNGLITYDRKEVKVPPEVMKYLSEILVITPPGGASRD